MSTVIGLYFGGLIAGIGTALPIGPTNLWMLRAALPPARRKRNVAAFVVGLVFFDCLYAALGYWGYSAWFAKSTYADGTMFVGGSGLVLLGLHSLWRASGTKQDPQRYAAELDAIESSADSSHSIVGDLSMGFLLGSNPSFIAYWIVVVSTGVAYVGGPLTPLHMLAVFFGILSGDMFWYATLYWFAKKYSRAISPALVYWTHVGIACAFAASGVLLLIKSFQ